MKITGFLTIAIAVLGTSQSFAEGNLVFPKSKSGCSDQSECASMIVERTIQLDRDGSTDLHDYYSGYFIDGKKVDANDPRITMKDKYGTSELICSVNTTISDDKFTSSALEILPGTKKDPKKFYTTGRGSFGHDFVISSTRDQLIKVGCYRINLPEVGNPNRREVKYLNSHSDLLSGLKGLISFEGLIEEGSIPAKKEIPVRLLEQKVPATPAKSSTGVS